jgi:hypothetical protein
MSNLHIAFEILEFVKAFLNKPGGILIDTSIRGQTTEDRFNTLPIDILSLGEEGEAITIEDISYFLEKVDRNLAEKHGIYMFERIVYDGYPGYGLYAFKHDVKAKIIWSLSA